MNGKFNKQVAFCFVAFTAVFSGFGDEANAACLPAAPYGGGADNVVCAPGVGENFDTLGGSDSVRVDSGSVGTIATGTGNDTVTLNNGVIVSIDQGSGNDTFDMNNGSVTSVVQGSGRDTFNFVNGVIVSIDQGASTDTATMSGGTIDSLLQGSGRDTLTISGGVVNVIVDQGSFADTLTITGGNINEIDQGTGTDTLTIGNAITGNIDQGGSADTFTMNAGALVDFLDQGAGFDLAVINGGHIIGLFEDGDQLDFHGGRIGSINLRQADNIFIMDGTTGAVSVDSFVNAEQGDDTFTLTSGIIGTFINTGSGDDIVTIDGTDVGTDIITERGDDVVNLLSGTVGGDVLTQDDNDVVTLNGATVVGSIETGDGDDTFTWSSGTVASFDGGDGSDTVVVTAGSYDGTTILDGGDDALIGDGFIDTLTLNGVSATVNGGNILNWEVLNFANSALTVNDLNIATLNVCGGSTTLGGASAVTDVLGCVSNDTVIVTGTSVIANSIEGAGGDDIISITGDASVTGGVFGDGNGQDASSASPGNDTITINTTGTIGLVDSGAGNDAINLLSGTIAGDINAGDGDDGFVWSSGTLVRFVGGDGSDTATITASSFNASHIIDGGDDVSNADGFVDILNLNGIVQTLNGANIINWENVVFNTGTTISFNDNALTAGTLSINNGAELNGGSSFALTGHLVVANGGLFVGTGGGAGVFSTSGNVTNNGLVNLSDGATGDIFNVGGNYSGTGTINLDTVLGASGSATDTLVVSGDSSGATVIDVTNVGGAGALTGSGPTDGIQVVQVGGSSDATFTLANSVSAGVFNYSLVKADDQNWYLQSALQAHLYGYSAVIAVLNEDIDTLWQRRTLRRELLNRDGSVSGNGSGFWSRGIYANADLASPTNVTGVAVQNQLHTVRSITQFGYEQRLSSQKDGYLSAGVFGHYKHFSLGVRDNASTFLASAKANGVGGGVSLTWNSKRGFYGDLLGQVTSYNVKVRGGSGVGKFKALTYSTSGEVGYRIELDNQARLVPMAQLIWRGSNFSNLTDSAGVGVNWRERDTFTGRVGLALEGGKTIAEGGNGLTGYVIANLLHDFNGGGFVRASGTQISSQINRTRLEMRVGANLVTSDSKFSLFTDVGFAHSLRGKSYRQFKGVAGLRINF